MPDTDFHLRWYRQTSSLPNSWTKLCKTHKQGKKQGENPGVPEEYEPLLSSMPKSPFPWTLLTDSHCLKIKFKIFTMAYKAGMIRLFLASLTSSYTTFLCTQWFSQLELRKKFPPRDLCTCCLLCSKFLLPRFILASSFFSFMSQCQCHLLTEATLLFYFLSYNYWKLSYHLFAYLSCISSH